MLQPMTSEVKLFLTELVGKKSGNEDIVVAAGN
jgi:hypothetical protein